MNESNEEKEKDINGPDSKEEKEEEEEYVKYDHEEEGVAVIPPNGGWGWVVVFSAFYCNIVVDGIQLTFGIFLKAISKDFDAEYSEVALAGSLMFGIHLLMGPVCSGCNTVFGLRPVTITGSLICCFGVAVAHFCTSSWCLYFTFGLIGGMGLGLVYMNTLVITSLYFTTLMPIAIAIVVCGAGLGTMLFASMSSVLIKVTTWQYSFLMQAALAGSMSLAAISFRPLKPVKVKISPTSSKRLSSEFSEAGETSKRRSVFIKTDMPPRESVFSLKTYQNLALSFAEVEVEETKKSKCQCCQCCLRKEKPPENKNILVLTEIRSDEPQSRRKSYVEKFIKHEADEEEEIVITERRPSSFSHKSFYTRIDMPIEKPKRRFCQTLKKTFIIMLDCRLLSSCSFLIFALSGAINLAAFLIVYIYEKDRCEDLGFSEETAIHFIIALGGLNVFWRLFLGLIAIIPKVRYWPLAITGMVIGGVATMVSGYSSNIYFQYGFCFFFGLAMASFAVFRMPMVIDMVGMEFLENAAGINLLFMGIFCIMFPPIFGSIKEATKSYNVVFMITGAAIVVSSLTLIRLKKVNVAEIKKKKYECTKRRKR